MKPTEVAFAETESLIQKGLYGRALERIKSAPIPDSPSRQAYIFLDTGKTGQRHIST